MKEHDNDNDPLPFITLAACTRNVIEFLNLAKQQTEDSAAGPGDEKKDVPNPEEHAEYVERRLNDIAAFERRYSRRKDRS